jgi:phenylalanine-4-hydroxylase
VSTSLREFTREEHHTWRLLFERQVPARSRQVHALFDSGISELGLTAEGVPELSVVNRKLEALTGFQGTPVKGLEDHPAFFRMLAERRFPIGNFIRDSKDLAYTPAPDVFHDLYGHIPFFADRAYAEFCAAFGRFAASRCHDPEAVTWLSRFFWFTVEFGLVETPAGRRIFGAGIASSFAECEFALSSTPEVRPFSVAGVCEQDFRIDELQRVLFVLRSPDELYASLPTLERYIRAGVEPSA